MKYFMHIEQLEPLEKLKKFSEIHILLEAMWEKDRTNLEIMLRLASECWYILTESGISIDQDVNLCQKCKNTLIKVTEYALEKEVLRHAKLSWFFGYAISLFPFLFYNETRKDKLLEWEALGHSLCKTLLDDKDSSNIVKRLCAGFFEENTLTIKNIIISKKELHIAFWGNTLIEVYFKEMLSSPF